MTLSRVGAALVLALVVVLAAHEVISADLWLHLATGERILTTHTLPRSDVYSFTATGHRWIDLHWGYQVLTALANRAGGGVALQILHGAAILAAFGIVLGRMLGERRRAVAIALVALLVLMGQERVLCRPEAFTLLFLSLTWLVSERMLAGRRPSPAWLLAQVAWANMQGLFILGPVLMALRGAAAWGDRRMGGDGVDARAPRRHALAAAAMLAVGVIGPYHVEGLVLPFRLSTQVAGASVYAPILGELFSPFVGRVVPVLLVLVLALSAGTWGLDRRRRLTDLLPALAFAMLALSARRNLLLFALLATPLLVRSVDHLVDRVPARAARWAGALALLLVAWAIGAVGGGRWYYEVRSPKVTGAGFSSAEYPVAATEHLATLAPGGHVFNMLGDGDYLLYHLGPAWRIAFDGRAEVYGESLGREILAAYADPRAFDAFVRRYGVDAILMDVSRAPGRTFVASRVAEGWVLRFLDGRGAVLTPPGSTGDALPAPPAVDAGAVPEPSRLRPFTLRARFPFAAARYGRALAALGYDAAAAAALGEAVRAFPHTADLFGDYGAALLATGRPGRARRAFEGALALSGSHDEAAAGLARAVEATEGPGAAIQLLEPWCDAHPGAEHAWITLAAIRGRGGDVRGAISTLETARRRISAATLPLARLLVSLGEPERAEALLRVHVSEHPEDREARAALDRLARRGTGDGP